MPVSRGDQWEEPIRPAGPAKSGLVTALAVVHFVMGGIGLICGCLGVIGGLFVSAVSSGASEFSRKVQQELKTKGTNLQELDTAARWGTIITILAALTLILGAVAIVAGIGVIQRRGWGKTTSFAAAGVAGLLTLGYLAMTFAVGFGNLVNALILGAYAGFTVFVLMSAQGSRDFSQG